MDSAALETVALRAVELAVQGRVDPRMVVAALPRVPGPRRMARFLAGLANAAGDRTTLLLMGLDGRQIVGVEEVPTARYWDRVDGSFPDEIPSYHLAEFDTGSARLVAAYVEAAETLVVANHKGRPIVPWFEDGEIHRARPHPRPAAPKAEVGGMPPSLRIDRAWIERSETEAAPGVTVYRGAVDMTLDAAPGRLLDRDVSATLMIPGPTEPVALSARLQPITMGTGVVRTPDGVEVVTDFGLRLYLAAARREPAAPDAAAVPVQLVMALMVPGRSVAELRSLVLHPDASNAHNWKL